MSTLGFWWCADCKAELNTLARLVGKGKNKKIVCFKCARKYDTEKKPRQPKPRMPLQATRQAAGVLKGETNGKVPAGN